MSINLASPLVCMMQEQDSTDDCRLHYQLQPVAENGWASLLVNCRQRVQHKFALDQDLCTIEAFNQMLQMFLLSACALSASGSHGLLRLEDCRVRSCLNSDVGHGPADDEDFKVDAETGGLLTYWSP